MKPVSCLGFPWSSVQVSCRLPVGYSPSLFQDSPECFAVRQLALLQSRESGRGVIKMRIRAIVAALAVSAPLIAFESTPAAAFGWCDWGWGGASYGYTAPRTYGYAAPRRYGYYGYAPRYYGGFYGRRWGWRGYGYRAAGWRGARVGGFRGGLRAGRR